jgi:anti-sigma regulatory factor (Ser/Thr protein kinase)
MPTESATPDRAGSDPRDPRTAGTAATHGHAVAFHDTDGDAVDAVAAYLAAGLRHDERVVAVATDAHLGVLDRSLRDHGLDLDAARAEGRFVELDATRTVETMMVGGSVDRRRFLDLVDGVLHRAAGGRPVRIFGEMVAVLWQRGQVDAALELEDQWNELAADREFTLLCGYLVDALAEATLAEVGRVCEAHSELVPPRSYSTPVVDDGPADPSGDRSEVFLPVASAVQAARRFVSSVLDSWGAQEVAWDAALVTSELATNAVRHGASPFRASVSRLDGAVRIAVEDVAPGRPDRGAPAVTDVRGRGVAIVEAVAARSGWHCLDEGKVAWAELAVIGS